MICFYIVRHGETLLNKLDRAQGWSDSPLTYNGEKTAIELGAKLNGTFFNAAYTSDTLRAKETAKLILTKSGNSNIEIREDIRLREWCLGSMDAEQNTIFIHAVSEWLGGVSSFVELNERLPDVAMTIYKHDTTGMAEPFIDITNRLKSVFIEIVQKDCLHEKGNILVVTHAFAIKTLFYLFAREQLRSMDKIKNTSISKLIYNDGVFSFQEIA